VGVTHRGILNSRQVRCRRRRRRPTAPLLILCWLHFCSFDSRSVSFRFMAWQVAIKKFHCPTFSEALVKKLRDEAPQLRYACAHGVPFLFKRFCLFCVLCFDSNGRCSLLKHGNLVEFVALCVDTEICSVTEWIEGANLYGYLRNSVPPRSAPPPPPPAAAAAEQQQGEASGRGQS
jgi:hypothetical protein